MKLLGFRVSDWDEPFWVNENRGPRRFNKPFMGPVQYWSLHPLTPWAEVLRGLGIRTPEETAEIRQRLWVARFEIEADHLTFDTAESFEMEPEQIISDDYEACQQLGEQRLNLELPNAFTVPSAALPGTDNLVVFGPLVRSPYSAEALSPEDVPASIAADYARPPETLVPLVRHIGEPHDA
ncbi:hypothetical protein BH20ACT23_BH20ACT23_10180 [soil metagenome]